MKRWHRFWQLVLIVASVALAPSAVAQSDPPGRAARLNFVRGQVSLRPATLDEWGPAALNDPLTTGDHLWTDAESWAELHVGSTAIRLAPRTAFGFLNLDDTFTQIRLAEGALDIRVRNLEDNAIEIDTPSAAISLLRPGVYRLDVLPDGGSTRLTVRYGLAEVWDDGPAFRVRDGEAAAVYGSAQHEVFRAGGADSWELWCRARDEREDNAASLRYISYEMTGYEDLDDNGTWRSEPDYGWVWQPASVAVGWAPYHHGHWRWIEPWGWTWVDNAPWGFAPFHYGRWACLRGGWVWVPGQYTRRPLYAPALVVFLGGNRWGASLGFGVSNALAWFPLGPGEVWLPRYRASRGYVRNMNAAHAYVANDDFSRIDVTRVRYRNQGIPGAVTAVPRDTFVGGHAVARSAFAVHPRDALASDVADTLAPVAPRSESVLARRGGAVARPTTGSLERTVVAHVVPPSAPVPFQARARALEGTGGRPLDASELASLGRESRSWERTAGVPVRVAGPRSSPAQTLRSEADNTDTDPRSGAGGSVTAGLPARADGTRGERLRTEASDAPSRSFRAVDGNSSGSSYRPSWAGQPATTATPTNPRFLGGDRGGARSQDGASQPGGAREFRPTAGDRPSAVERSLGTADSSRSTATPGRSGSRTSDPDPVTRPLGSATVAPAAGERPSSSTAGIEVARPRWGGERPGGEAPRAASPAADSAPLGRAVERPRGGDRPSAPTVAPAPASAPAPSAAPAPAPAPPKAAGAPIPGARPHGGRGGDK